MGEAIQTISGYSYGLNMMRKLNSVINKGHDLENLLINNKKKLRISSDGFVSVNMQSEEAKQAFIMQIRLMNRLRP